MTLRACGPGMCAMEWVMADSTAPLTSSSHTSPPLFLLRLITGSGLTLPAIKHTHTHTPTHTPPHTPTTHTHTHPPPHTHTHTHTHSHTHTHTTVSIMQKERQWWS